MNVCFLLHFYQPSNQFGDVVKQVAHECYIPLIKSIRNNKQVRITANFSLSLLEQLDTYGFGPLLKDIKDLVATGRIELVGSAAYHPLLTKIPLEFVDKQIILDEMALGYYFGAHKDFEGEDCFMIKGLKGFFPPEMAVSKALLEYLASLGYDWVAVDDFCFSQDHVGGFCYTLGGQTPKLVVRSRRLTNLISFSRTLDRTQIVDGIMADAITKLLALDAETFGHHFKDGVDFFESIVSDLADRGCGTTTVSEALEETDCTTVSDMHECTWSSVSGATYPLWDNPGSPVNTKLWALLKETHEEFTKLSPPATSTDLLAKGNCLPIWKAKYLEKQTAADKPTQTELLMLKLEQSDQFWWSTGVEVMGKKNYSRYMVESVLDYYQEVAQALGPASSLLEKITTIRKLLETYLV